MTTSLGKRSSINGISDIAYSDEKAPVYTSTNQFVQGTKTFNDPINALSNVLCSGFYYGNGSHLTNLPIVNDPSKLPLAGGTMTGAIVMSLSPAPVVVTTITNEHIEIVAAVDQVAAFGFSSTTTADPKLYLQNGVNTMMGSATNIEITTPNDSATLTSGTLLAANPALLSTFTFTAPDMFFKWDAGTSFKIDIDDHHVTRDMAFKVVNGIVGGQVDFENYEYYLEQPNLTAGWSVIISEGSGSDATINNPDGLWFYGFGISGYTQQSTFQLKKWSTARITLVPSTTFAPGFAWAVSMY